MHRDFKELLSAFNEGRVKYLVVGGYAVSIHAEPRATKDLVEPDCHGSVAFFGEYRGYAAFDSMLLRIRKTDSRPSSPKATQSIEPPPPLGAAGVAFASPDAADIPPAFAAAT